MTRRLLSVMTVVAALALGMGVRGATAATLELDYKTYSAGNITVTGSATTLLTADPIAFDGTTPILVEYHVPQFSAANGARIRFNVYQDGVDMANVSTTFLSASTQHLPLTIRHRFTPSAGTHTYSVRATSPGLDSIARCATDDGGSTLVPCSLRITLANPDLGGGAGAHDHDDRYYTKDEIDAGAAGGCGTLGNPCVIEGSAGFNERADLGWWGTWAIVGLLLVAMVAPSLLSAMRTDRGL